LEKELVLFGKDAQEPLPREWQQSSLTLEGFSLSSLFLVNKFLSTTLQEREHLATKFLTLRRI